MGNPFLEQGADLLVLDTRIIADASVIATVRQMAVIQFHRFLGKVRKRHEKRGSHITRLQMLLTSGLTDQKV